MWRLGPGKNSATQNSQKLKDELLQPTQLVQIPPLKHPIEDIYRFMVIDLPSLPKTQKQSV